MPKWYESTQGPQLSLTFKALVALLLPVAKDLFGFEFDNAMLDNVIDAALIVVFGVVALYGHVRATKTLGAKVETLVSQVENLGGKPDVRY